MMGCAFISTSLVATNGILDGADKGIIPLTCEELFRRLDEKRAADSNIDFRVEVSYIEVCKTSLSPKVA